MIFLEKPEDFNPKLDVVGCYLECDGTFLMLLRHSHKMRGDTWGIPAGKVEKGESRVEAMIRELEEETGFVANPDKLQLGKTVCVRFPEYDFWYHMFRHQVVERPPVTLEQESHKEYRWVSPEEALTLPLVQDQDVCTRLFYTF